MPAHSTEWTLEMLHALPDDGNRYELVDGELLVSPSPSLPHQQVLAGLFRALDAAARGGAFDVYFAPLAIPFSPRRELQPDLLVVPRLDGRRIRDERELARLVLAVEVLSPSTARHDRVTKRRVYQEHGVAEYWIVDPEARLVERWCPGDERPEILTKLLSWTPPGSEGRVIIDLEALFRDALD